MGNRATDLEEFLMLYPHLARWVNECLCCHHKGYKPEMPKPRFTSSVVLTVKLRRLAGELALDEDSLCQQCRQTKFLEGVRQSPD
jgi:hypothetical protein